MDWVGCCASPLLLKKGVFNQHHGNYANAFFIEKDPVPEGGKQNTQGSWKNISHSLLEQTVAM
jgi:hypothetical protein